jgi:putative Holliday junction resolvase
VRFVGVDLGRTRIGLAVSDASGTLARPARTLLRGPSDRQAATALQQAVEELAGDEGLGAVVMGLPRRLDGTETDETAHVRAMAERLRSLVGAPVVLQDERLTSREAESRLALRERNWRKRKARLDAAAAAIILQDYLDARHPPAAPALPSLEE